MHTQFMAINTKTAVGALETGLTTKILVELLGSCGELFDTIFLQFGTRQSLSKAHLSIEDEQQRTHSSLVWSFAVGKSGNKIQMTRKARIPEFRHPVPIRSHVDVPCS
jgi:hypothetical protein